MKKLLVIVYVLTLTFSSLQAQPIRPDIPCQEGINLLPMYGEVEKCLQQLKIDKEFLTACDKQYANRKEACEAHREMGWQYMHQGDLDTAMKRFNQAWLLNRKDPAVYSSFGWLLTKKESNEEAVLFFEKSVEIGGNDDKILTLTAAGYIELYKKSKDGKHRNRALELLRQGLKINPGNTFIPKYLNEIK